MTLPAASMVAAAGPSALPSATTLPSLLPRSPAKPGLPAPVSLWGLLIPLRREFDEYVNLRPVRLFEGVPSPLANRKPGEIDFWVVRENTEGEYSSIGGRMFQGTDDEMAIQQAIFTRKGVDRVLKFAFEFASKTKKKHVTSAPHSNRIIHTRPV